MSPLEELPLPALPRALPPEVEGHPFAAEFQVRYSQPDLHFKGFSRRDRYGRTRLDFSFPSASDVSFVRDVVTGTDFVLFVSDKTYERSTYTAAGLGWMFSNAEPEFTEDHQDVFGVDCVRVRLLSPRIRNEAQTDVGETWLCQSLGLVMVDTNPSVGWHWQITSIDFHDIDESIFQVPADFQELT